MQKIVLQTIEDNYEFLKKKIMSDVIRKYYNIDEYELLYSKNGKPYIKDNKIYLSISNDNNKLLIVFDTKPVGADIQFYRKVPVSFKKVLFFDELDDKETVNLFSKKEAIIKLIDSKLCYINEIDVKKYKVKSYIYDDFVISIANYD